MPAADAVRQDSMESCLKVSFRGLDAAARMTYDVGLLIRLLGRLTQKKGLHDARQSTGLDQ